MDSTDRPKMSSARGLGRSYPDRYPMDVFSYTREAAHCGLPSNALLSPGESLDSDKSITFVYMRNKIAHGDISYLVSDLADYDPEAERMADEHEEKMRRFVSEWFNTAPDVQEGHIVNNRWPK